VAREGGGVAEHDAISFNPCMSFQRGSVFDDAEAEFDRLVPCA
jgi:hypothetical protein